MRGSSGCAERRWKKLSRALCAVSNKKTRLTASFFIQLGKRAAGTESLGIVEGFGGGGGYWPRFCHIGNFVKNRAAGTESLRIVKIFGGGGGHWPLRAAFSLEGTHGAEAFSIAEILHKAERNHRNGDQREHIGVRKAGHCADQGDDGAGGGEHGETECIDLAARDECGEFFAVKSIGHERVNLLESEKLVHFIFCLQVRKPVKIPLREKLKYKIL